MSAALCLGSARSRLRMQRHMEQSSVCCPFIAPWVVALLLCALLPETVAAARTLQADCKPIALLHKAHWAPTHFMASAVKLQKQIEECGGYYRVILLLDFDLDKADMGDGDHVAQMGRLLSLQDLLGKDKVVYFGPKEVEEVYKSLYTSLPFRWRRDEFGRYNANAHELIWNHYHRDELPAGIDRVWTMEFDVGWTGDVARLLASFPPEADLVCYNNDDKLKADPNWEHVMDRNWPASKKDVRWCKVYVARYSSRLLDAIAEEVQQGHSMHCEIAGATVCSQHSDWCKVQVFKDRDEYSAVGQWEGKVRWTSDEIRSHEWAKVIKAVPKDAPAKMYHKLGNW